eukprot:CAMPEP_0175102112 /NCGR_PEP_ID=MMETSP0086_2-20121207/8230_1 /TAXON_ID=136419 /ORGANISM="Unknown Unknown, Strain D1" /LENGTH=269 /DNA_ID=CAMNT_0016376835 /DNA_START=32 /DNA_END=841 /DNA_ORIENTATION=+
MSAVENIVGKIMESSSDREATRQALVNMARLSECSERYEDMCVFMRQLVLFLCEGSQPLTTEERNLLSVAYKNVIGTRRASWRFFSTMEDQQDETLTVYSSQIQKELFDICHNILSLLEDHLLKNPDEKDDAKVFFLKMTADYYRYLCEPAQGDSEKIESAQNQANKYYKEAHESAQQLKPTNPIRLGLALNYSVFYFEILKDKNNACKLAKTAFDEAISKLDKLQESDYKDSTLIMQLLRDNLTLWTSGEGDGGDEVTVEDFSDDEAA